SKSVATLRKRTQRVVGVDDDAIGAQQRDTIGEPVKRIFQDALLIADSSQARRHVVRPLIMRAESLHERDLPLVGMALSFCPLNRYCRQFARCLFEHGS